MNFNPLSIKTDDIKLSKDLLQLSEIIAENVHNVWASSRISQGWTFGEERNDSLKKHPCLVPYSELPESEKDFDRNTANETFKLIQKLGFKIIKTNK